MWRGGGMWNKDVLGGKNRKVKNWRGRGGGEGRRLFGTREYPFLVTMVFPSPMKNAIMAAVYKTGTKTSEDNYRPVSIFLNISRIYERLMFK